MGSDHQSIISFKPMICLRPSSCKDVVGKGDISVSFYHHKCQAAEFVEPASPRVGCMGQIKRDKVRFSNTKGNKFVKLKKIFSGKSLTRNISTTFQENYAVVSSIELDPPLPVPKRVVKDCDAVSLWKRRCGQTLEGLQLQQQI